jgi:putative oligomerization/nucleic acid binding protein
MFGKHELLEHRLRKSGKAALAKVTACERKETIREGVDVVVGVPKTLCYLELQVQPEGESAFEAKTDAWMIGTEGAHVGMTVPVLYDPSDHAKVVVDNSEEAWRPADKENAFARIGARAAERGEDPSRTAAMMEMRRAALDDPEGFRKMMREQGPAAFGLPGMPGPLQTSAPAPSQDPLDRLSKLADLHDRGALTDAEFEAEKKKLLES